MSVIETRRVGRAGFWRLIGLCATAMTAALYVVVVTANETSRTPVNVVATTLAIAAVLVIAGSCMTAVVVGVWRLRDRGKSGFWLIAYYAAPLVLIAMGVHPDGGFLAFAAALALLMGAVVDLGCMEAADVRRARGTP